MSQKLMPAMAPALVEVLKRDLPELFEQSIRAEAKGENRVLLTSGLCGELLIVCDDPDSFEAVELDSASRPLSSIICDKKMLGSTIMDWVKRN